MTAPSSLRLFLGLPCPPSLTRQIAGWRQTLALEGSEVHPADLHLTLAFLGQHPTDAAESIAALVDALPLPNAFNLRLERLDCWRGGLLHLAPGTTPAPLLNLQQRLAQALIAFTAADAPSDFRPHLTLARHSRLPAQATPPTFDWPVDRFALFESQMTADLPRYRQLSVWQLPHATDH